MTIILSPKSQKKLIDRYTNKFGVYTMLHHGEVYLCEKATRLKVSGNFCELKHENQVVNKYQPEQHVMNLRAMLVTRNWQQQQEELDNIFKLAQEKKEKQVKETSEEFAEMFKDMQKTRFSWLK
jgi:hypothetical protein